MKKKIGSAFFSFSRRATRDDDRMEIRKCDGREHNGYPAEHNGYPAEHNGYPTQTGVGARDTCVSKKGYLMVGRPLEEKAVAP